MNSLACTSCFCLDRPVKVPLHIVEKPVSSSLPVPFRSSGQQIPIRHIALGFIRKSFRAVRMRGESERVAPLVLPSGALRQKNRPRLSQRADMRGLGSAWVPPRRRPRHTHERSPGRGFADRAKPDDRLGLLVRISSPAAKTLRNLPQGRFLRESCPHCVAIRSKRTSSRV